LIDEYIKAHGKRLYGLCRHLCAHPFDADDLYQDTWMHVVKNISRYDASRAFEPWLTKICVNTYRKMLKRARRTANMLYESQTPPTPAADASSALRDAVSALPERLRLTVILFYFRDMDISSTAQVLGIPEGTVKSRLNKARKLLKEALTDETGFGF